MKIALAASMMFSSQMVEIRDKLVALWHEVILPYNTEKYASKEWSMESRKESTKNKIEWDLFRGYFNILKEVDAILIVNYDKNGIANYIGGNSFLEAAFAHILNKTIYFLNPIPEMIYTDELKALWAVIINGDMKKIH